MRSQGFVFAGIAAMAIVLGIALYWFRPDTATRSSEPKPSIHTEETPSTDEQTVSRDNKSAAAVETVDPRVTRLPDQRVQYNLSFATSRKLEDNESPEFHLEVVSKILEHYRYVYQENPVGVENFEIVEQLNGKNPKRILFIDPSIPQLQNNELLDAWGTPYFFHAVSAKQMDIHSAGPDKTLWTDDDIELKGFE